MIMQMFDKNSISLFVNKIFDVGYHAMLNIKTTIAYCH